MTIANTDMGVYKNFKAGERLTIQFRMDFFNLFNKAQFLGDSQGFSPLNPNLDSNSTVSATTHAVTSYNANPAYGVLLVTGLLMVFLLPIPITTLWIVIALVLYAVLIVLGLFFYTPTLRNQIKLVEAGDTTSAEFNRLASRGQILGQALGVIVLVILAMMVFKPTL